MIETARNSIPIRTTALAAIPNFMEPHCSGFAARTFAPSNTTAGLPLHGQSNMTSWSPTTDLNYCVGGNTKFYGAALFRLRREDFCTIEHHGGTSPAWPIQYDELEPYYGQAEHCYHVHGERGEDPTVPPASGPYPHPAVSHEPRIQQLAEDFAAAGLRPFHTPLGVMLDEKNPH